MLMNWVVVFVCVSTNVHTHTHEIHKRLYALMNRLGAACELLHFSAALVKGVGWMGGSMNMPHLFIPLIMIRIKDNNFKY